MLWRRRKTLLSLWSSHSSRRNVADFHHSLSIGSKMKEHQEPNPKAYCRGERKKNNVVMRVHNLPNFTLHNKSSNMYMFLIV